MLQDTRLINARHSKIPMEHYHTLQDSTSHLLSTSDASSYRKLVGRLIYLTVTRPDLAYLVPVISQFLATPKQVHLFADRKVVRYLKTSPGQLLIMRSQSDFAIHAFCDSDWLVVKSPDNL